MLPAPEQFTLPAAVSANPHPVLRQLHVDKSRIVDAELAACLVPLSQLRVLTLHECE